MPILMLLAVSTVTLRDYIEFSLGKGEMIYICLAFLVCGIIIAFFAFFKLTAKYTISVFVLFTTLVILILGISSLPERRLERAKVHYQRFDSDLSSVKHDKYYSVTIDYIKREQKARQLELEVAELRYYGPKEFYGIEPWMYILFLSNIGLMFAYGICLMSKVFFEQEV